MDRKIKIVYVHGIGNKKPGDTKEEFSPIIKKNLENYIISKGLKTIKISHSEYHWRSQIDGYKGKLKFILWLIKALPLILIILNFQGNNFTEKKDIKFNFHIFSQIYNEIHINSPIHNGITISFQY